MILSELIIRQIKKFLLGDRRAFGWFRLSFLVIIPVTLFVLDALWTIFSPFSSFFRQVALIYFLGLISAFTSSIVYIRDIYEQETDKIPFRHFTAGFFGVFIPKVKVTNKIQDSACKEMVEKIGGPAFLNIGAGYT